MIRGDKMEEKINETKQTLKDSILYCLQKINDNVELAGDQFLTVVSKNQRYGLRGNKDGWTQSFWTGMLWLAFEETNHSPYLQLAQKHTDSFKSRADNRQGTDTHDLGFLYTLSCVADYKITGNVKAKEAALLAADLLLLRFKEKGEFIQAWGDIKDPRNYRLIIDCFMNLPLLFWATEITGDDKYKDIAIKHAHSARKVLIREDASTYHTYYFNPKTGEPDRGVTHQGYADDSCWSRGQAWGVYGLALCYKYTGDEVFLDDFKKVTDYYLAHQPKDQVAYWDLYFTEGEEERDSSAAAIAVCGLLEMADHLTDRENSQYYRKAAMEILQSLIENYTAFDLENANGFLLHGVYSKPGKVGVDEMTIWGDYFFMEALVRSSRQWKSYW